MVGLICFFIFVVLVTYECEAVRSEVGEQSGAAVHVGKHPFSEKRKGESRYFLQFFEKFLKDVKHWSTEEARRRLGEKNLKARILAPMACSQVSLGQRPRICRTKRDLQR